MSLPAATQPPNASIAGDQTRERGRTGLHAVYELTKPRITRMVTITSGVGFALGAVAQTWDWKDLVSRCAVCLLGTALSASGANALNQWWERDRDAIMPRTCARPLPTERVSAPHALGWGLVLSVVGVGLLGLLGLAPALVSIATILIYVLLYTPLKPVTTVNTLIGAVPGALPPLIGWTAAATGNALHGGHWALEPLVGADAWGGWSLFALMFVWQIPHFLAIAWMYRDDYAKGGYRMLPISDPDGQRTAGTILLWAILLLPATLGPPLVLRSTLGWVTVAAALITGGLYVWLAWRLWRSRTLKDARRVFFASIAHLPLLLMVMVGDALVRVWLR